MACILRSGGRDFDVDRFLKRSHLNPTRVFRRDEPVARSAPRGRKNRFSGFNMIVSKGHHLEFDAQVRDALRFLKRHQRELQRLTRAPGLKSATLDFGVSLSDGLIGGWFAFPGSLVQLAAKCGLMLEVSVWQWEYWGPPPPKPARRKKRTAKRGRARAS